MERNIFNKMQRRRIYACLCVVSVIWAVLAARLFYWQILCHETLSEAAVSQYQVMIDGLDPRGMILDRNGQPLTGGNETYFYFLQNKRIDRRAEQLLEAVKSQKISAAGSDSARYSVYRTSLFDAAVNEKLQEDYGAYVFCGISRYQDNQAACHLIGYLNLSEQKGVSGLEQQYEETLRPDGRTLALWADGSGNLLSHVPPQQSGTKQRLQSTLVTTIDRQLQTFCERSFYSKNLNGTVLVSEAESGQVLAWVSSPGFNPNRLEEYLGGGSSNLVNKCIQGLYAPGSVFKIVVAAAALEQGEISPLAVYNCTGETEVNGVRLGCQAGPEGGHGTVNMYEAVAASCNCYFAQLGERLGVEAVLKMAQQLGFGEKVFDCFQEETAGNLPDAAGCGPWDISNLSIGQGEILVTPAQVQQMMAVVACGGVRNPLTVVMDGDEDISAGEAKRVLSESSASRICDMLQLVMTEGTGSSLTWPFEAAGKTGTAEAVSGGQQVSNCWFSGFCRAGDETYVVTVLVECGVSGSASALPVFHEICEYLVRNTE